MSRELPTWIERFLGIAPAEVGQGTVWQLDSSWGWAPWVTMLVVVFSVAWVVTIYSKETPTAGRRWKTLLIAVRLMLIGLVMLMLAELMVSMQRTGLPSVVVVIDNSASMSIADRYDDRQLRSTLEGRLRDVGLEETTRLNLAKLLLTENDAALLTSINDRYKLKVYFMSDAARTLSGEMPEVVTKIQALEPIGQTSKLGAGVRTVLGDLRGTPPAAIVVLTDGITTAGETLTEVAAYARRKGVPLFTVGLGSEQPVRDIRLADLLVDEVVFVNDVVQFRFTITATGLAGRQVEVTLREKESRKTLASTKVHIEQDSRSQNVRLSYRPTEVGDFQYVVEAEQFDGETQTENNRQQQSISVRKEQVHVLLAQSYPNFEYRYLKALLERDSTIALSTVLFDADLEYAELDQSALQVFPVRRDDLFRYDVIVFGDVNPALLSASIMSNINAFVQEKGGGIIFIAGPHFTPLAYRDTPIAPLFPIDLNTAVSPPLADVITEGFTIRPTDLGLASPQMQLGDTSSENAQIWRQLPPVYWLLEAPIIKPGTRVLAEHPSLTGENVPRLPIFCMQYVGAGKVLFHATDATWRWRYRVGDIYLARYWVQSIRFLARSKLLGKDRRAELTVDRREYRRGEPVRLRVRFTDERRAPADDDGVTVVVQHPNEKNRRVQLQRNATSRGIFEGVLTGTTEGSYHVWMATPSSESEAPAVDFLVVAPPGELEILRMDVAELAETARRTRGQFYQIATAGQLIEDLPPGRQIPIESLPPVVLWNQWWVLLLFLSLLITEWILRKRKGML